MNWIPLLRKMKSGNNKINYITLVRIPDDHPVFLAEDWADKYGVAMCLGRIPFKPVREICEEIKKNIWDGNHWGFPEVILGKRLPESCILWTKDFRLLYGKESRKKINKIIKDLEKIDKLERNML